MMAGNLKMKGSENTEHPCCKAGDAATQRAGLVAEQTGPAHRTGVECARCSVRQHHRHGGSQDLRQRDGFMPLLGHVAAAPGGSGFFFDANQPVQDQPLAIGKEQDGAKLGVCCAKRAHEHGGTGRDQGMHAVAFGFESNRFALLQERDNGLGRGQGRRSVWLGGEGHGVLLESNHSTQYDGSQPCWANQ